MKLPTLATRFFTTNGEVAITTWVASVTIRGDARDLSIDHPIDTSFLFANVARRLLVLGGLVLLGPCFLLEGLEVARDASVEIIGEETTSEAIDERFDGQSATINTRNRRQEATSVASLPQISHDDANKGAMKAKPRVLCPPRALDVELRLAHVVVVVDFCGGTKVF